MVVPSALQGAQSVNRVSLCLNDLKLGRHRSVVGYHAVFVTLKGRSTACLVSVCVVHRSE